jgi:bacteriocin biosynthesis cyclodehydratase domain-containing protein
VEQLRPRIKRTIRRIEADGDLILLRTAGLFTTIKAPNEEERQLLASLDGNSSLQDLERRFPIASASIVALQADGVIEDAADLDHISPADLDRFDRQLRYFGDVATSPSPADCQERLGDATVAVLGCGGLGGRVALDLASIGIGEMWLVDGDRVETSNLNRQIQFSEADVGNVKVEALADRVRSFNSRCSVRATAARLESQEEIAEFIAGAGFVVDAIDWPAFEVEEWCNAACFGLGIPYIGMSHEPPLARIGPLYVPGKTGCHACEVAFARREHPLLDLAIEQMRSQPSPAPTLGPACGFTAGQVAMEVMHFLTGLVEPATLGSSCVYDLRTMEVKHNAVVPEPACRVCGNTQRARHR